MNTEEKIEFLIKELLDEMPEVRALEKQINSRRLLLRSLMNLRPPMPLNAAFLTMQDQLLQEETLAKGVVTLEDIPAIESTFDETSQYFMKRKQKNIRLWQGDITRLQVDAIVNAANSQLLGCCIPCHECIDNAIHSAAGLQLRQACYEIMMKQGHDEPTGHAKITPAFNLPSKFVIHTVGPIVRGDRPTIADEELLADCYQSCLELAVKHQLKSIAFCCISTGEFRFPNERAAQIAVSTVKNFLLNVDNSIEVVFNVFKDLDLTIYKKILGGL